jgi:hypothetical protein
MFLFAAVSGNGFRKRFSDDHSDVCAMSFPPNFSSSKGHDLSPQTGADERWLGFASDASVSGWSERE